MTPTRLLLALLLSTAPLAVAQILRTNDTVAICGDSITEQRIYSVFIEEYFLMCQPVENLNAHQIGWSGEKADEFRNRVKSDVLPFAPNVATTFYGMNDGNYRASDPATVAQFKQHTLEFIRLLKQGGVRSILVGSPGAVDSEKFKTWGMAKVPPDTYNQTLADLAVAARAAAAEEGVGFVDIHGAMLAAEKKAKAKYGAAYPFAHDGVHPQGNGHLVIADAFLNALGCTGDLGTITVNISAHKAIASGGHKVLSVTGGRVELESTRYPFCFVDDAHNPEGTRAILDCVPFNDDLNRLRLVVLGATTPKLKVTWGANSKIFSVADLARGINLAAEFLDNPFVEPFKKVQDAVRRQQEFETHGVKNILHSLPGWTESLPEQQDALDQIKKGVVAKSIQLENDARAAVVPVRHTLLVEPAS